MAEEEDVKEEPESKENPDIVDFLEGIAAGGPIKVQVARMKPKQWQGKNIEGVIDTFDEPISEEELQQYYGGGVFRLNVKKQNKRGSWIFHKSRTVKIAGDPKVQSSVEQELRQDAEPSVVHAALKMTQEMAERAEKRADRTEAQRSSSEDTEALRMIMGEMSALREENNRLIEKFLHKPETSGAEVLLGKAIEGESARILSMQARMDSELRTRADMYRDEISRLHTRHEDNVNRLEQAHQREVDNLRTSATMQAEVLKLSYDGQIKSFEREISRLQEENSTLKAEMRELRAMKEKSPLDTLTELSTMKEAMSSVFGTDKEESSPIERVVQNVVNSPLVEGIATRIAASSSVPQVANPAPASTQTSMDRPVRLPDGRVVVRKADGRMFELRPRARRNQETSEEEPQTTPVDLSSILPFMEASLAGDADPEAFVRTARSMSPEIDSGPIAKFLRSQGAEGLIELVQKSSPNSPLLSQRGKNWLRKVVAVLLQ